MGIFSSALDYFVKGGPCMWPLLLCSFSAIAIGVERYLYFKKTVTGTVFVKNFVRFMNDFNLVAADEYASQYKGAGAKMCTDILNIEDDLGPRLESIVYADVDRIIDGLEDKINYLSVIIGLAPMIGLLGTITGMISSFNALNERTQNPMAVTSGIGEALITTVFGLCIAILGMCIHAYLVGKIKSESLNLYELAGTLSDILQAKNSMYENMKK